MKKVIITGASGFIGRALTSRLAAQGCQVYAIVRDRKKMVDLQSDNLQIAELDLSHISDLPDVISGREFDVFYHLAWEGTYGDSFRNYRQQMSNAVASADALSAAAKLKCRRFVLAGTVAELEVKHYLLTDGGKPRNTCNYGMAKLAAEMLCRTLAHQLGVPFNTAMLANVYGVGDQSRMIQNTLIYSLMQGKEIRLIHEDTLQDWLYIDDAVSGLIMLAEKGMPDMTYYVGHQQLQTFGSLVKQTRDIIAPAVSLRFGTAVDQTLIDYDLIDRNALNRDTGFVCQADFAESITQTAQWLQIDSQKEQTE